MLDLSVLDSGKIQLAIAPVSLAGIVRSVIETSGYASHASIAVTVPEDMVVQADSPRLFIVIDSLLSNAVRYSSPPRRIAITGRSDSIDPFWHLAISDNGEGIPADSLDSIFEPFQLPDAGQLSRKFDRIGPLACHCKKDHGRPWRGDLGRKYGGQWQHVHPPSPEKSPAEDRRKGVTGFSLFFGFLGPLTFPGRKISG